MHEKEILFTPSQCLDLYFKPKNNKQLTFINITNQYY